MSSDERPASADMFESADDDAAEEPSWLAEQVVLIGLEEGLA
jgi:hypothetical protein